MTVSLLYGPSYYEALLYGELILWGHVVIMGHMAGGHRVGTRPCAQPTVVTTDWVKTSFFSEEYKTTFPVGFDRRNTRLLTLDPQTRVFLVSSLFVFQVGIRAGNRDCYWLCWSFPTITPHRFVRNPCRNTIVNHTYFQNTLETPIGFGGIWIL